MKNTVRASDLAAILEHKSVATIQNPEKNGCAPYLNEEFEEGAQRRYNAEHGTKLVLVESLRAQGATVEHAGRVVRNNDRAIKKFFDEVTADLPVTPRFVLAMKVMVEDTITGTAWHNHDLHGYGTEAEVCEAIASEVKRIGIVREVNSPNRDPALPKRLERYVGGPWVVVQSIPEAYRLLKARAKAKGYIIDGRAIYKIAPGAKTEESDA
jgi:hypothetical protein